MKYQIIYNQAMIIEVEAKNEEEAIEIVKSGEFDEADVDNNGIDLSSVEIYAN